MKKFCDIQSRNELADYLSVPRNKLTHILYVKKPDSYYTTFEIPKRNGETRTICAPSGDLKTLQEKLSNMLWLYQKSIWEEKGIKPNISIRKTSDNYSCRRWGQAISTATICNEPQGISWQLIRSDLPHNPAGVLAEIIVVLRQAEHTGPAPPAL